MYLRFLTLCFDYGSSSRDADSSALAVSVLQPTYSKGSWDSCVQTVQALSKSSKSSRGNTIVRLFFLSEREKENKLFTVMLSCCCSAAEAQVYEKTSLQGFQQLVHRSFQTLALWKLLCEHQFSLIISELPKVSIQQSSILALCFFVMEVKAACAHSVHSKLTKCWD